MSIVVLYIRPKTISHPNFGQIPKNSDQSIPYTLRGNTRIVSLRNLGSILETTYRMRRFLLVIFLKLETKALLALPISSYRFYSLYFS